MDAVETWKQWKSAPSSQNLAKTVNSLQPVIDSAIKSNPGINAGVVSGEAKRLAINAIKTYDPIHGADIKSHVFNHLKPLTMRGVPSVSNATIQSRYVAGEVNKVRDTVNDFREEHNREPDDDEVSERLMIAPERVKNLRNRAFSEVSASAGEDMNIVQQSDPSTSKHKMWVDAVRYDLDPVGRQIFDHRTGYNGKQLMQLDELATKLQMSPSAVHKRSKEIAERIAEGLRNE